MSVVQVTNVAILVKRITKIAQRDLITCDLCSDNEIPIAGVPNQDGQICFAYFGC